MTETPIRDRGLSFEEIHKAVEGEISRTVVALLWGAAVVCVVVSLWINVQSDEKGGIYLRATLILYLSLVISVEGFVVRSVRAAAASTIIILAVSGLSEELSNIPLFMATGLSLLHMVASVLTYRAGALHPVSGIRGVSFVLLGFAASVISVFTSLYNKGIGAGAVQAVAFGTVGIPLFVLANGIPKASSAQVISCYSLLAPCSAAMYSLGDLTDVKPWVIAATGVGAGSAAALLSVTTQKSWEATAHGMVGFLLSSKLTALGLLILYTFGNIATINGVSTATEERVAITNSTVVVPVNMSFFNATQAERFLVSNYKSIADCINERHFALASSDAPSNKNIEELLPLLLMGLSKGAIVVVLLSGIASDKDEANAWSIGGVLGICAVIWLAVEGRGRCLLQSADVCDPNRSYGFIAGLSICGIAASICLVRAIWSGAIVQFFKSKEERVLAHQMRDDGVASKGCCDKYWMYLKRKLATRDSAMAIATTALLICLIASSTVDIRVAGSIAKCGSFSYVEAECSAVRNSSCWATTLNHTGFIAESGVLTDSLSNRIVGLAAYWQHTAWMISGVILVLAMLAVESLPKSPSVGIALFTGLLIASGLTHFACLMSHLNSRLATTGLQFYYHVNLNVYIIGIISVVIGVAWGIASVNLRPPSEDPLPKEEEEKSNTPDEELIVFQAGGLAEEEVQNHKEEFRLLEQHKKLDTLIAAGLVRTYMAMGHTQRPAEYYWAAKGSADLPPGVYYYPEDATSLARCVRCAKDDYGKFRLKVAGDRPKKCPPLSVQRGAA